ncbi:ADP-ribose pyrophosphatase [Lunatimonas lonarensis]|uniref:GDP-mannose pyrophosphatase n=1 Tax=Lunatimonas lonarensis TaxID=1232681 RepID=R7ZS03_9BACT|nr:NUDIX hydrolase [Lunatimonas lonarensis]EON76926.1 ADP-ribose pyrophosphatase [Lunatimonas lonarensis]
MQNPWKTLSKQEIYSNPWIRVEEHQVINPKGGRGIYGQVHFKNIAIGIIPLDLQLHTWIVGQYRYTLDEYSWEIPMGGSPMDDMPEEGARRELKEETGMTAKIWRNILKIHTSNSVTDEVGYVFLAEDLTQGETEFDETEDLKIVRLPFVDVVEMVLEGKITDGISIAGILKAERILKESGRL